MPYGLILELMAALILVGGAPEPAQVGQGVMLLGVTVLIKAALWYGFCVWYLKGRGHSRARGSLPLLEWMALVPLIVDFYVLDLNSYILPLAEFIHLPSLNEIVGLGLFIAYLSLTWLAYDRVVDQGDVLMDSALRSVTRRVKLLLPIILPYLFITVLADLLSQLPIPVFQRFLHGEYGPVFWLLVLMVFFLFFLPELVRRLWRCKPLPPSELRTRIEEGLKRQGLKFSDILVWDVGQAMACTAAVIGIVPGFRYILLTPCLIRYLSPEEIEAVIAHEAEHVRQMHILWYVLFLVAFSLVLYKLSDPLMSLVFSNPVLFNYLFSTNSMPDSLVSLLAVLPLGLITILYFRFVIGFFMRNFERQADMAVFRVQGHPFYLISALKKVALISGIDPGRPNWHHYSIVERVGFLTKAYENRGLLQQHNRRLLVYRAAFIGLTAFLVFLPRYLPTDVWKEKAKINSVELFYKQFLKQKRDDPRVFLGLGALFYQEKQFKLAEDAYKKALSLDPNDPEVLNNLAWLYATSKGTKFFHPKRALELALKAARQKPAPYILDTLAECFFVNGYLQKAVELERQALARARKNRGYYQSQLQRFQEALAGRVPPSRKEL